MVKKWAKMSPIDLGESELKLFGLWQVNAETATFPQLTIYCNMTAMRLSNVFDDRQTQARSAHIAAAGFVYPVEALEEPRQMLFSNADAMVLNADNQLGILLVRFQQNCALWLAVFKGIIQQINYRLLD
jgi:hypothetical protein